MQRGARGFLIISMIIAVLIILLVLWRLWGPKEGDAAQFNQMIIKSGIENRLDPVQVRTPRARAPEPEPEKVIEPEPKIPVIVGLEEEPLATNDVTLRRLGSSLTPVESHQQTEQRSTELAAGGDSGPLADQLRPLELRPSVAGQLG